MSTKTLVTKSILIVEDSPTQAESLRALLDEQGATVTVARSGEDALEQLKVMSDVDLILSDIIMPGMSGYDLCRAIKQDKTLRHVPVVILTSLSDPLDTIRGLECGADNYITKPYNNERLIERLLHVFENRESRRKVSVGASDEITFLRERFTIDSERAQILDFFVSSFEDLVLTNEALRSSESERATLYESERHARMEAEAANQAKSEFLAAMSHDLRTPLNAIGGYAALLAEEIQGPITDAQRSYLERIRRNQKHLLALVNDVLNFARVERGQVAIEVTEVPVNDIIGGVRAMIEPQVLAKSIKYYVDECEPVEILADRERTEQVLMNLLGNAVKFTPVNGRIIVTSITTNDMVTIQVIDTGVGIPDDRLETIFDPFVQVDSSRASEQQGVGLGLAISRNLARLMGGELTVTSVLGEGSKFSLHLRRAKGNGVVS